jgi:predicted nucleic acid-binding protein
VATPVFVDTGAHYALTDANNPDHAEAVRTLQKIERLRHALITSNFVVSEVYTLLLKRLGQKVALSYVNGLRSGSTTLIRVTVDDEERVWEILQQYRDQDFSYVDATSFAVMERLNIGAFFAFDTHFSVVRTRRGKASSDVRFVA